MRKTPTYLLNSQINYLNKSNCVSNFSLKSRSFEKQNNEPKLFVTSIPTTQGVVKLGYVVFQQTIRCFHTRSVIHTFSFVTVSAKSTSPQYLVTEIFPLEISWTLFPLYFTIDLRIVNVTYYFNKEQLHPMVCLGSWLPT